MVTKVCQVCGKEYQVKNYKAEKTVACSVDCQKKWQDKKVEVECKICGKKLMRKPSRAQGNVFCSNACVGKWNGIQRDAKVTKKCVICGKEYKVKRNEAEKSVACSIKCQGKWQSKYRVGKNHPNWIEGVKREKECVVCGKKFKVKPYAYETAKCCSKKCHGQYLIPFGHSEEAQAKRIKTLRKPQNRENSRKTILKTLSTYPRETSIEKAIREWLETHNINHIPQCIINDKFCVDFYLPENNVIIEALGDYFHANPLKYGEGKKPLSDIQKKNIRYDKSRFAYLDKCGYSVYGLWEYDIRNNLDELMESITELQGKIQVSL